MMLFKLHWRGERASRAAGKVTETLFRLSCNVVTSPTSQSHKNALLQEQDMGWIVVICKTRVHMH